MNSPGKPTTLPCTIAPQLINSGILKTINFSSVYGMIVFQGQTIIHTLRIAMQARSVKILNVFLTRSRFCTFKQSTNNFHLII